MALSISCLSEILDCLPSNLYAITTALSEIISTEVHPLGESVLIQTLFSAMYTKLLEASERDTINRNTATATLSRSSICNILAEAICSIDEDNKHTEAINNLVLRSKKFIQMDDVNENEHFEDIGPYTSNATNQCSNDTGSFANRIDYNIDQNATIPELICGDLLSTSVGRQCAKVSIYSPYSRSFR